MKQATSDIAPDSFAPKKSKRKPLLILVFVLINVAVIAMTAVSEFGSSDSAEELAKVKFNFWLLIPAALCFLVGIVAEIYKYVLMMRHTSGTRKNRNDWKIARRTVLLGKYYDNITPAAIGGQPFQIYYMHKNGKLSAGMATTIPIVGMISNQLGFLIIAVIAIFGCGFLINNSTLTATACLGLLFYAFWPIAVLIATFLPKTTSELISLGVRFCAKLHLVKNKTATIAKVKKGVNEYAGCMKNILKTRGLLLLTILLSVAFNLLTAVIPFFVLTAFGGEVNFMVCLATTIAVTAAVYFVPTPGNSGAAEGTFFLVFSGLSSGYVFWTMLVWRLFSYYIYILMGPAIYLKMHSEKRLAKK